MSAAFAVLFVTRRPVEKGGRTGSAPPLNSLIYRSFLGRS